MAGVDDLECPRKYELIRIGNEIGFPKRVVQVWFQNMRARDRRRGKEVPYFPSMARYKRDSPSHSFSGWSLHEHTIFQTVTE
jgi:hypothetical protein